MKYTLSLLALAVAVRGDAVTATIPPTDPAPAGFSPDFDGAFQISAVSLNADLSRKAKREVEKRACFAPGSLTITLEGGVLVDSQNRTGYVASNYQFQFDGPPQDGAIYTGGFSVGANNTLALGGSAVFYECLSGDFYNLYDRTWAEQCSPVVIEVISCSGSTDAAAPITEYIDGQPQVPTATPTAAGCVVSEYLDGQIQVTTCVPSVPTAPVTTASSACFVTQISDGQIQVNACSDVSEATGPTPATTAPVTKATPATTTKVTPPAVTSVIVPVKGSNTTIVTSATPKTSITGTTTAPATPIATGSANSVLVGGSSFIAAVVALAAAALL
jgi:hypothetical protein